MLRQSIAHVSLFGKRVRDCGKEIKRISGEGEEIIGETTSKEHNSKEKTVVPLSTFASSSSNASSATHLSYLSSILSSVWPSEGTKEANSIKEAQRVKSISAPKSTIFNQTRMLIFNLLHAETENSIMLRTRELRKHYMDHPEARTAGFQLQHSVIKKLKCCLRKTSDEVLKEHIQQFLLLMGDVGSPRGAGIRVLSIDGGGTRGILGLDILQALETSLKGPKVVEVFDLIVGVSTGAIIGALLTAKRLSIKKCKEIYVDISKELFSQGKFSGMSGLILSHSYYNTEKWRQLLKDVIGEGTLLEICGRWETPKLSIISCTVNTPTLQPYIFRTYEHPKESNSHYRGGYNYKIWEALQASAAAPGYFEEVALGSLLHQDGGVLTNNPTALAIHEARMLWPQEQIQCVVSVGNGRTIPEFEMIGEKFTAKLSTRLREKILRIIDSATDTELVDLCMRDVLPKDSYLRFSPYTSYPYPLDEIDPKKLEQMSRDAQLYISRNQAKFEATAEILMAEPSLKQRFTRNLKQLTLL